MKAILYFEINEKKICQMAYQLLELSEGPSNTYIDFCVKEVYDNYPATMVDIGKQYIMSKVKRQVYLAKMIVEREKQFSMDRAPSYEIKDLQPSMEHQYIYQKAQVGNYRKNNKRMKENFTFLQLFPSRTLKYGVRTAHVVIGRKNEMLFQVNPFISYKHSMELPVNYVKDPVSFYLKRKAYLEEVSQDAIDYKGLSTSAEREG